MVPVSPELVIAAFNMFGPMIFGIVSDHFAKTGTLPTAEEVQAKFAENMAKGDAILAEGVAWKVAHPKA